MIAGWKRQAKGGMPDIFAKGPSPAVAEKDAEIDRLHEKVDSSFPKLSITRHLTPPWQRR